MSRIAVGRGIIAVGVIAFLHAAFSAYEFLTVRKSFGLPPEKLPLDITIETLLAFIALVVGITLSISPLKKVTWSSEMRTRTVDVAETRPSFATFDHRGSALFSNARNLVAQAEKAP